MATRQDEQIGWPTLAGLGLVVAAFMGLSLLVTATGTARFAAAMGYDANVGYAVGAIFDLAKGILPVALAVLLAWRMLGTAASFGAAWLCLVVFSCLATHATVSTAISTIERTGAWRMEVRGNTKAELASVEQQLAALSRPGPPRPAKTVQEALASERPPSSVWHDTQECSRIQESAYFARACKQVAELRRELAAAQDYERLALHAAELRKDLAQAPIVATSDPLPAAFTTTLGRVLPLSGTEGVALLLTVVVEIMSSFGLVGVAALYRTRTQWDAAGKAATLTAAQAEAEQREGNSKRTERPSLPPPQPRALPGPSPRASQEECQTLPVRPPKTASSGLPKPSLKAVAIGLQTLPDPPSPGAVAVERQTLPEPSLRGADSARGGGRESGTREPSDPPSNILPWRATPSVPEVGASGAVLDRRGAETAIGSHVSAFVRQRLRSVTGASIGAKELRAAYEAWCAIEGQAPLSLPRFAAELAALGYGKWKSCGVMRYRGLQLAA